MDQLAKISSIEALALSPAEARTFPRWYTDLLLRKRTDIVTIGDVTSFVDNFGISESDKVSITTMFGGNLVTLDPPQFYIYLRLTGHILQGKKVRKELAFVAAPVPKPKSILSRKHPQKETSNNTEMDSFMSLMTGKGGGGVRKRKRVTFDSKPPQITEAAHRSMSELLRQSQIQEHYNLPGLNPQPPSTIPSISEHDGPDRKDPEPDQPITNNQFSRVNIESVLHNGQSMLPEPPAPRKNAEAGDSFIQQLTQSTHSTQSPSASSQTHLHPQSSGISGQGSAQFLSPQASGSQTDSTYLGRQATQPNGAGLQPNGTGINMQQNSGASAPWQYNYWSQQQQQQQQQQPQQHQRQKLGPQSTGSLPLSMHPQYTQSSGLQPQLSGMQPQFSGLQTHHSGMQPQFSGIQPQYTGMQPQMSGMQPQLTGLQSQLTGLQPQSTGLQSQSSGMQAPMQSQFGSMHPVIQSQAGYAPAFAQQTGFSSINQQQQQLQSELPGMQFINSIQAPQQQQKPDPRSQFNGYTYNV